MMFIWRLYGKTEEIQRLTRMQATLTASCTNRQTSDWHQGPKNTIGGDLLERPLRPQDRVEVMRFTALRSEADRGQRQRRWHMK